MKKRRSKDQKCSDYFDAFKAIQAGTKVKRSIAKDGSIPTHSCVPVDVSLSEAEVLKDCLTWLARHRILANRNNVGCGMVGESGFYSYGIIGGGDVIGCLPNGQHFEIECKRGKGGRLSLRQQKRMRDIRKNNGIYYVIHGLAELEYYFRELLK
ncbi:hypothetical protein LCGC14_1779280 [marine sediment metagenome]|uniref:VRR-NUC domain-containing protein n=1 Tax=marine sediment metagenome TaxID=412755 RepID=A0A0F9GVU4_9ZZZZ